MSRIKLVLSYYLFYPSFILHSRLTAIIVAGFSLGLSRYEDFSDKFFLMKDIWNIRSIDDFLNYDITLEYYVPVVFYIFSVMYMMNKKDKEKKRSVIMQIILSPLIIILAYTLKILSVMKIYKKETSKINFRSTYDFFWKIYFSPITLVASIFIAPYYEAKVYYPKPYFIQDLETDFFKPYHVKTDEITRANSLNLLKNFSDIFSEKEWSDFLQLFRDEDEILDYLLITEGYLTEPNNLKYDEVFESRNPKVLESFRAFNGRDKVYFSFDFIEYFVKRESKKFRGFLNRRFLKRRTRVSAEVVRYFNVFLGDSKFAEKLIGINNTDKQKFYNSKDYAEKRLELEKRVEILKKAKAENNLEIIKEEIINKIMIWFKFFMTRLILQRYTNVSNGILVVKIADYTTRMISEIYMEEKIINITQNINDGKSDSFEGDGLTNLFLYMWNAYLHGRNEKVLEQLEFNINTISDSADVDDMNAQKFNNYIETEKEEAVKKMENDKAKYNS